MLDKWWFNNENVRVAINDEIMKYIDGCSMKVMALKQQKQQNKLLFNN